VTTAEDKAQPTTEQPDVELVTLTIDDHQISVPKGTLVIRAAELMGVQIPRFCDHPLLEPVGACRQCLVEVEGQRKPMASCTITVTPDMVVRTQLTSEAADKAQHGVMELLLINHPLDCPVCDKGGECPLQNQAMSNGQADTRFTDVKRTFPKPINLSSQVLLDRERCVLCARCTRFSNQIAGDPFIELLERGALQQVGIATDEPFDSYFSGNTVQICPVGALTGAAYRFRSRPFDLVSSPGVCEHCASSEDVGVIVRACEPVCTGVETTDAVPASQVHGLSAPLSKPGLATAIPLPELPVALALGLGLLLGLGLGLGLLLALALGDVLVPEPPPEGSAMIVTVRLCTPQPFACEPGNHTSTVSFWIQVPMSPA